MYECSCVVYGEIEQQKFSQLTCCLSVCDGEVRYGMSALHTKTKINGNFRETVSQSTCSLKSSKKKTTTQSKNTSGKSMWLKCGTYH